MDPVLQVPMADIVTLIAAVAIATAVVIWLFVQPVIDRLKTEISALRAELEVEEPDEFDEFERVAQAVGWGQ